MKVPSAHGFLPEIAVKTFLWKLLCNIWKNVKLRKKLNFEHYFAHKGTILFSKNYVRYRQPTRFSAFIEFWVHIFLKNWTRELILCLWVLILRFLSITYTMRIWPHAWNFCMWRQYVHRRGGGKTPMFCPPLDLIHSNFGEKSVGCFKI